MQWVLTSVAVPVVFLHPTLLSQPQLEVRAAWGILLEKHQH